MQIHEVKPKTKRKLTKRVGRGGKRGKTAGRGHKGQKARAGHRIRPALRDIIKSLPKKRGYRFSARAKNIAIVKLSELEKHFAVGERVSPKNLLAKDLIKLAKKRLPQVKILAMGALNKSLTFRNCQISGRARELVLKAGGKIETN